MQMAHYKDLVVMPLKTHYEGRAKATSRILAMHLHGES